jgi:hypothetical protein
MKLRKGQTAGSPLPHLLSIVRMIRAERSEPAADMMNPLSLSKRSASTILREEKAIENQILRRVLKAAVTGLPAVTREPFFELFTRLSKASISALPWVARKVVLEQLCDEFGLSGLMPQLARCGVVALKVSGSYGVIQSSSDDTMILTEYAKTGKWAERTNNLLRSFFANGSGNYIDLGANIGLTTIPVAQNPRVRCLAIEPEPGNFASLCVNVAENCPYKNVEVRCCAVFVRRQTLQLELSSGNLGKQQPA